MLCRHTREVANRSPDTNGCKALGEAQKMAAAKIVKAKKDNESMSTPHEPYPGPSPIPLPEPERPPEPDGEKPGLNIDPMNLVFV